MDLISIFNPNCVGIDFGDQKSEALNELGFKTIKLSVDLRRKKSEKLLFSQVKQFLHEDDVVFIVAPKISLHVPIVITMIYGITKRLPNIVYFNHNDDPDLRRPLVSSLSDIRHRSEQATLLNTEYYSCA